MHDQTGLPHEAQVILFSKWSFSPILALEIFTRRKIPSVNLPFVLFTCECISPVLQGANIYFQEGHLSQDVNLPGVRFPFHGILRAVTSFFSSSGPTMYGL